MKNIQLTSKELEIADWAIDAMPDFFENLLEEEQIEKMPEMPKISGNTLQMPDDENVIADFLYRIEEQYIDMVDQEPELSKSQKREEIKAAESLAEKVK